MPTKTLYAVAVGVLVFVGGLTLNLLHVVDSMWRAALVGGGCAALVYWIGPKLVRRTDR